MLQIILFYKSFIVAVACLSEGNEAYIVCIRVVRGSSFVVQGKDHYKYLR